MKKSDVLKIFIEMVKKHNEYCNILADNEFLVKKGFKEKDVLCKEYATKIVVIRDCIKTLYEILPDIRIYLRNINCENYNLGYNGKIYSGQANWQRIYVYDKKGQINFDF